MRERHQRSGPGSEPHGAHYTRGRFKSQMNFPLTNCEVYFIQNHVSMCFIVICFHFIHFIRFLITLWTEYSIHSHINSLILSVIKYRLFSECSYFQHLKTSCRINIYPSRHKDTDFDTLGRKRFPPCISREVSL